MKSQTKEWYYLDESSGQWLGPMTLDELDAARKAETIEDYSRVTNSQMLRQQGAMGQGISYYMISRLDVEFTPSVEEFREARDGKQTTVLSGPNNSGKTLLLKQLFFQYGQGSYLVACNRFSHVDILNTRKVDEYEHRRYYDNFSQQYYMSQQNSEDNELKLEQILTSLKNGQREKLFALCKELLGNTFSLQRTERENDFSPFYVDMDGENLRYGSSGTRLLLTLLGILLDERFTVLLIDEPEIGLSPRIQAVLSRFLYDEERRLTFCPHLRQLFVATHSHLFLDRHVMGNNHVVTKSGSEVTVRPIMTVAEYHQLQFNMLGNEMEAIFMPAAIVIVEGDSDHTFLAKVLQLHIPNRKVAVVRASGEGEVRNKLYFFKEAFGDLAASPYRNRLFVVLDKQISVKLPKIEQDGVPKDNIIVLSMNGIEYFYPPQLLAAVFLSSTEQVASWKFEADPMEFNGIRKSKKELAQLVTAGLNQCHATHPEVQSLIAKIEAACR